MLNTKGQFDAKLLIRRLRRKFPTVKFYMGNCPWCKEAKAVYIKIDNHDRINGKGLCNRWNRETYGNKGILKEFDEYLVKKQLSATWNGDNCWSEIFITPKDFEGYYAYYGKPLPKRVQKPLNEENQKLTDEIIKAYKKLNINATIPKGFYNSGDRNEIEFIYNGMTIRNYVMKKSYSGPLMRQVKENLARFKVCMKRWEPQIQKIYNYYKNFAEGHFWVMPGGGMQLQVFYGDDKGYVGILYLDIIDEPDSTTIPSFAIERAKVDKNFKSFKDPGFEILTFKELCGS